MFVFGLVTSGSIYLFNTWSDDYGLTVQSNLSNTYSQLNSLYEDTNETYQQIEDASGGDESGNFLTNLAAIWRATKLLGKTFTFGVTLSNDAAEDLNLPSEIRWTILGLLLVSIIAILITVAARSKLES